jgi:hypothetical protein
VEELPEQGADCPWPPWWAGFYRIGVLEMSPAASNAANFDLPIGLSHGPRDGSVVLSAIA